MAQLKLPRLPADGGASLPPEWGWKNDAARRSAVVLLGRREFLKAAAILFAALATPVTGVRRAMARARGGFFTAQEFATLEALSDRIIPPDHDPGAKALGAASDRPGRPQEGGRDGDRAEWEALRQAPPRRAGPSAGPLRRRRLPARPAPRRDDLHLPRDRAHARGLPRAAGVRRQPGPTGLEDARPRGRQPTARLLDLLQGQGRLQRAPRAPHVDRQSRRAATRYTHATTDLGRRQRHSGF